MKWKNILLPVVILFCMMGVLFGVSTILEASAEKNITEEQQQTLRLLLPGSETFEAEDYEGEDTNITGLFKGDNGYVVETTVAGYVDDIVLWVGVEDTGKVTGVTVREMSETWGLGREAMTDMKFLVQFLNGTGDAAVGENIDALSGATVTSKAVTKAVNSAVAFMTGADTTSSATEWGG